MDMHLWMDVGACAVQVWVGVQTQCVSTNCLLAHV